MYKFKGLFINLNFVLILSVFYKLKFIFITKTFYGRSIIPVDTNVPSRKARHPKALYVLFFTEMWERFAYYLMVGILFLYLIDTYNRW